MTQLRDADGILRPVEGISLRDADGILRAVSAVFARDAGNNLYRVFNSGGASVAPGRVTGSVNSKASRPVTTTSVALSITGGVAPFSIVWSIDDSSWSVTNPGSASTAFRSPSLPAGEFAAATAFATVTDAVGTIFTSNTVQASATNTGFSGV